MQLPSLAQIRDAQTVVYRSMPPTPQYTWPLLNQRLGTEAWIKHENHTPVGAFKLRGALVYIDWLKETQPGLAGVAAATRGNHGQGVAMAARLASLKAVIVVPRGNSREKNRAMIAQGAELIEHGDDFQESLEFARTLAAERGFAVVDSFHERLLMGTATYALELFEAAPPLDAVVCAHRPRLVHLRHGRGAQCSGTDTQRLSAWWPPLLPPTRSVSGSAG